MLPTPRSKARLWENGFHAILWEYSLNLLLAINFNFADIISPLSKNGFLGSYWQQCENHNLGKTVVFCAYFVTKIENFWFTRESLVIPSHVRELCLDWIRWFDLKQLVFIKQLERRLFFVIHIVLRWKLRYSNRKVWRNRRQYSSKRTRKRNFLIWSVLACLTF